MKISLVSVPVQDPLIAHEIYTTKLGFESRELDREAGIAVVVSPLDPRGTALLLEPCKGSFYENFQSKAYEAKLPIIVLSTEDVAAELQRLRNAGVTLRPDLDRPRWGLMNIFEDGCGNLLMLEDTADGG